MVLFESKEERRACKSNIKYNRDISTSVAIDYLEARKIDSYCKDNGIKHADFHRLVIKRFFESLEEKNG